MAERYAYALVTGKLGALLGKVHEIGVPTKVSKAWLQQIGFKSSNDAQLIGVLKQIRFVDSSGIPTKFWRDYRGKSYKAVLGNAIRTGYSDLFKLFPNANARSAEELAHFFSSHTTGGKQVINTTTGTFRKLCELADFSGNVEVGGDDSPNHESTTRSGATAECSPVARQGTGVAINLNLQIALPESKDGIAYEKFFEALKKHLLTD